MVITDLRCDTGTVRVVDAMIVNGALGTGSPSGPGELARLVTVLDGEVDLQVHVTGRGGLTPSADPDGTTLGWSEISAPVKLTSTATVDGLDRLDGSVRLKEGDRLRLVLRWADGPTRLRTADDVAAALDATAAAWRAWTAHWRSPSTPPFAGAAGLAVGNVSPTSCWCWVWPPWSCQ